jgi:hypothetical protein
MEDLRSPKRLAQVLLVMGVVAAIACLFGPESPWGGVDVGATGASSLMVALVGAIWLFSTRGAAVFPEEMSIAERRAWIGLLFIGIVLLCFGTHLWTLWAHEIAPATFRDFIGRQFIHRIVVLIIVWSVILHLIGRAAGGVEADERDLRLRHHARRVGDWAFTLIVIACISVLASVPMLHLEWWLAPIVLANVLIGLLIVKSFVEHVTLTFTYRFARG